MIRMAGVRLAALLLVNAAVLPPPARGGRVPANPLKLVSYSVGNYSEHAAAVPSSLPRYDLAANRIIFTQRLVRIAVAAGADDFDAVFEINGLANPDIEVARGARITFDVINLSSARPEYFVISPTPPPYPITHGQPPWPWSQMRTAGNHHAELLPGRNFLHAIADVTVTYVAEYAGSAYYLGPFARAGQYGRIVVVR